MRVLVVEDDADTRANLCDILELDGHEIETAASVAEALDRDDWRSIAAIILDRKLPDGSAEDLLPQLRQLAPEAGVIVATGFPDLDGAVAAIRSGVADYILKPINPDVLRARLGRIAEHRHLEQEKARSDAAFRTLVETTPALVTIMRPDRSIVYLNPYGEALTGYTTNEIAGKDARAVFLREPAIFPELDRTYATVMSGHAVKDFEMPLWCKDGTKRWGVWSVVYREDFDGAPAIIAAAQDITKLKEAQEQVVQSERLAAIGQMMAGLAHESRNALQRSQACLEMVAMDVQDRPDVLEMVTDIQKSQDYLHHLYEEVRGYAAPINLKREPCHLGELLDEVWLQLSAAWKSRRAHLKQTENGLDLSCEVDRYSVGQVFRNILENSLAACPDPLEIQTQWFATDIAGRPALLIALRDNGPGLTPEAKRRIFEPFFTTKTRGTGLGMAIAKRIVEAHGGQIEVGPESGRGAEILIRLPKGNAT
jgi:hypothetical protein